MDVLLLVCLTWGVISWPGVPTCTPSHTLTHLTQPRPDCPPPPVPPLPDLDLAAIDIGFAFLVYLP